MKPEEVRRREREEAREQKRAEEEAGGKRSVGFHEARRRKEEAKHSADRVQYEKALRQSIILVSIFVIVVVGYFGLREVAKSRFLSDLRTQMSEYEVVLDDGERVMDLSDPVGALASWRSAWMEQDLERVVELMSPQVISRMGPGTRREQVVADYKRINARGGLQGTIDLATNFAYAEMLHVPQKHWRDQQLALFRSQPMPTGPDEADDMRYILAFSYEEATGRWLYADLREDKYFSVRWKYESMIQPLRVGPRAPVYDERGDVAN